MLIKHDCKLTAFSLTNDMRYTWLLISRLVILRYVAVDPNLWQVYLQCNNRTCCHWTITFLSSIRHLSLRVFHYFKHNICHCFWKFLFLVCAWRCWYTASFSCCFQSNIDDYMIFFYPPLSTQTASCHVNPLLHVMWSLNVKKSRQASKKHFCDARSKLMVLHLVYFQFSISVSTISIEAHLLSGSHVWKRFRKIC